MKAEVKKVKDLLKLLEGVSPETELWTQDTRDNECFPIVNLPEIVEIVKITINYASGGSRKIWTLNDPDFIEEEGIEDTKVVVMRNG